jgi:hypothetical protein
MKKRGGRGGVDMRFLAICFLAAYGQEPAPTPARQFEPERLQQLLNVRRVLIEKLSGENSNAIRDMLIASVQNAGLFIVTENAERADAVLKGSAEDLIYTDTFQYSEGAQARGSASANTRDSGRYGSRNSGFGSLGVGENESARIAERRHEAVVSVRLVNRDGDVIWSTTQESRGAKFRGASADVADKVTKRLVEEYEGARKSLAKPR